MSPVVTFLTIVSGVSVAMLILLMQRMSSRDRVVAELREAQEGLKTAREDARQESRDLKKSAEKQTSDIQELRKQLKDAKARAYKAGEKVKQASATVPLDWDAEKEKQLRDAWKRADAAETALEALRREQAKQKPTRVERPAPVAAPVVAAVSEGEVNRLREKLETTREDLADESGAARQRDRELLTARKLALQHERSFQVVRAQLEVARERLRSLGEPHTSTPEFAVTSAPAQEEAPVD